jgi:ribonucleoside-diphosphate reductase alpha chain
MSNKRNNFSKNLRLSSNAIYILEKRYLGKDSSGTVVETPSDMFRRVAHTIASAETIYTGSDKSALWERRFYKLMANLEFLPNSPALINAGRNSFQLPSCFMLPVQDKPDFAEDLACQAQLVQAAGGGTGFNFSGISSGIEAIRALHLVSDAIMAVKQCGIRHGCSIVLMDVGHPDILEFIHAKDNPEVLPNFYLAIAVTEEFMHVVEDNCSAGNSNGGTLARQIFDAIVAQTWKTGDPGIVFWDRIEKANPVPHLGKVGGVSGCGEQILLPYESCILGSINLTRMLTNDKKQIDYARLGEVVDTAVRFLDDAIDVSSYPLPQIRDVSLKTRKIGLGVMGFADMLIQLGIPYASETGIQMAEALMSFINERAHQASMLLARERGNFPAFQGSIHDYAGIAGMRNASCTTIAPTGTISLIAGCSSGIEPLFAPIYIRRISDGDHLLEVNHNFVAIARARGFYNEALFQKLAAGVMLSEINNIPADVRDLFAAASEIDIDWHVRMQAAFQKYVDNAVSKTVNLPASASIADVARVYRMAWKAGLKGITIYRDGSRLNQPFDSNGISAELILRFLEKIGKI